MKNILPDNYRKIGRIKYSIYKQCYVKSADIYISENQIKHIENKHGNELAKVGMSALEFITMVCNQFNQIRKTRDGVILVIYNENLSYTAIIELQYLGDKDFWEVKTAGPRRTPTVEKKVLIWEAAKHTSNGNRNRSN